MTAATATTACTLCGEPVTAKDPARYPYCRNCHYTGSAAEHIRNDQMRLFAAAFPEAQVAIEHTGGGCMWLAIRWPDEAKYIVLTDGEACLPETDDGEPVRGGWGYIGRHDDTDAPTNPDYEGTALYFGGYADEGAVEERLTDEAAVELIRELYPRDGRIVQPVGVEPDLEAGFRCPACGGANVNTWNADEELETMTADQYRCDDCKRGGSIVAWHDHSVELAEVAA